MLNPENISRLLSTGRLFYLAATPETIFSRLAGNATRPLAAGFAGVEDVARKLAERAPYYAAIPDRVDTDGLTAEAVAAEVLRRYRGMVGG